MPTFDLQLATAAYNNLSHSPERGADMERRDFDLVTTQARDEFVKAATGGTEATYALAASLSERFHSEYLKRLHVIFHSMSRCASAFIVGPARFPVERMRKRHDIVDKRREALRDWSKRCREAMVRQIRETIPPEVTEAQELEGYRRDLERRLSPEWRHSGSAALIIGKIERAPRHYHARLLQMLRDLQALMPRPLITDRHRIWKLADAPAPNVPTGCERFDMGDGATIERDHDEGRVRIYFPGRPDAATIGALKRAGWRWSPRSGAWQRMNTNASMDSARTILTVWSVKPAVLPSGIPPAAVTGDPRVSICKTCRKVYNSNGGNR